MHPQFAVCAFYIDRDGSFWRYLKVQLMNEQETRGNLITIGQARGMLGVSRTTMARLVKEGRFTLYQNPLDRRQKLVDIDEVRELATPVLLETLPDEPLPEPLLEPNGPNRPGENVPPPPSMAEIPRPPVELIALPSEPDEDRAWRLLVALAEAEHAVSESAFVLTSTGVIIHGGLPNGRALADLNDVDELLRAGYLRVLPGVRRRLDDGAVGREFVLTPAVLETLRHLGGDS